MATLRDLLPNPNTPAPVLAPLPPMSAAMPAMDAPIAPVVTADPRMGGGNAADPLVNRRADLEADIYKRENPIAPTTALGKIGHVASQVGNVLGEIFAPGTTSLIPGSDLNNRQKISDDEEKIQGISQQQTEADQRKQTEALTNYTQQRPEIEEAKVQQKIDAANNRNAVAAAKFGLVQTIGDDGNATLTENPDSQQYHVQAAKMMLAQAQAQEQQVLAQRGQPGSPLYNQKQEELDDIRKRIGIAQQQLALRGVSVQQAGQRLDLDTDKQYNPQPTAAERGKGDLAQSAVDRIGEMKAIVAKHPEYFGPVAGRAQNAAAWLGSSDPDAVTYNTAAQYLADHSAGVFGGRGQYITQALHGITNPKYTPEGLNAALDEADRAARGFVTAGTVHPKGQTGAAAGGAQPLVKTFNPKTGRLE